MAKQQKQFGSRWFRVYHEAADDPKLIMLSDKLHRFLFTCWCLASKHDGYLPGVAEISVTVRKSPAAVVSMLAELHDRGLLDREAETFAPHNWMLRQYKSDVSTQRVKAFRERNRNAHETLHETFHETHNETVTSVSETAPEQSRTEQSRNRTDAPGSFVPETRRVRAEEAGAAVDEWFEARMQIHPKKRDVMLAKRVLCDLPEVADSRWRKEFDRVHGLWCETESWRWKGGANAPTMAQWITDKGWKYPPAEQKTELDRAMEAL